MTIATVDIHAMIAVAAVIIIITNSCGTFLTFE
jgi:hypothetical protein